MFGNNIKNRQKKLNSNQTEKNNVTKENVFFLLKKVKHFPSVHFLIHSSENFFFKITQFFFFQNQLRSEQEQEYFFWTN